VAGNARLEDTPEGRDKAQAALNSLHACAMNQSNAALALGLSRQALQRRLAVAAELGLKPGEEYRYTAKVYDLAGAEDKRLRGENVQLRDEANRLRAQLRAAEKQLAAEAEIRSSVFKLSEVGARPPDWTTAIVKGRKAAHQTPILFSSDKQFGEVVRPSEINGFNAYDVKIAEKRHKRLVEATLDISFNHEADTRYDGFIYLRGGDEVSGEIHAELAETNELSSIPAVQRLLDLEVWTVRELLRHFGKVLVVSVPGNHGRTTFKPRAKRYAELNYETLLAYMLEREFRGDKRVSFYTPASGDAFFKCYEMNLLLTHGDRLGSRGGTGFLGAEATIIRGMRKTIAQYARQGQNVDMIFTGHFHTTCAFKFGYGNGSPVGYSEYAHSLRLDPEPPQQWLVYAHPTRGITHDWKLRLDDEYRANQAKRL